MRKNITSALGGYIDNWATTYKLSNDFVIGPRNKHDDDGGEPPGYISVITHTYI